MNFFGEDKFLHFIMSYLIALVDPMLALVVGVGKEVYDALGFGVADVFDLVADGLGILAAL